MYPVQGTMEVLLLRNPTVTRTFNSHG